MTEPSNSLSKADEESTELEAHAANGDPAANSEAVTEQDLPEMGDEAGAP